MSNLTTAINVNVDTKTKKEATNILKGLGLNTFLTQIVKRDGIPFRIENPHLSKKLIRARKEADDFIKGKE